MKLPKTKRGRCKKSDTYVARYSDRDITKRTPVYRKSMYETIPSKRNRAFLIIVRAVIRQHMWFLKHAFDPVPRGTNTLKFYSLNNKALRECFGKIADRMAEGENVPITEAEEALVTYAQAHPDTIVIGQMEGFNALYLNGPWPTTATLHAIEGKKTVIIKANGV